MDGFCVAGTDTPPMGGVALLVGGTAFFFFSVATGGTAIGWTIGAGGGGACDNGDSLCSIGFVLGGGTDARLSFFFFFCVF